MKKTFSIRIICHLVIPILLLAGCTSLSEEAYFPGTPAILPGTLPEMNTPGYWISLIPDPDKLIMDTVQINQFNQQAQDLGFTRTLSPYKAPSGEDIRKELTAALDWLKSFAVYFKSGEKVPKEFIDPIQGSMGIDKVPEVLDLEYGFLLVKSDLRVLPCKDGFYDAPGDWFSDNLQVSSLELGIPLVITHRSQDNRWVYVSTDLSSGWVERDRIVFCSLEIFDSRYLNPSYGLVVVPQAEVYSDPLMKKLLGTVRMGNKLVMAAPVKDGAVKDLALKILLPSRDGSGNLVEKDAWIMAEDIRLSPLPFTPRTVIRQAFRHLNAPYGWGGMFGAMDCSQFLWEVYSTMGIKLPRNSGRQVKVGVGLEGFSPDLADEKKIELIRSLGVPGGTILQPPGHIMLYIGTQQDKPYVIHCTWAYKEPRQGQEVVRLVNRVVVSDLDLGIGTKKGTLIHRLQNGITLVPAPAAPIAIQP